VKVEVQIRTIAMDCWASLEHQLRYKQSVPGEEQIAKELLTCAEMLAETDARMLAIRREIEHGEETEDVDTQLLEKLKRLDVRI
jgi:putative GTP pyrophosphokinase